MNHFDEDYRNEREKGNLLLESTKRQMETPEPQFIDSFKERLFENDPDNPNGIMFKKRMKLKEVMEDPLYNPGLYISAKEHKKALTAQLDRLEKANQKPGYFAYSHTVRDEIEALRAELEGE